MQCIGPTQEVQIVYESNQHMGDRDMDHMVFLPLVLITTWFYDIYKGNRF